MIALDPKPQAVHSKEQTMNRESEIYLKNASTLFVNCLNSTLNLEPEQGVDVLALPFDRGIFSAPLFIEHRVEGGYVDTATVAEASILDLMLLARL